MKLFPKLEISHNINALIELNLLVEKWAKLDDKWARVGQVKVCLLIFGKSMRFESHLLPAADLNIYNLCCTTWHVWNSEKTAPDWNKKMAHGNSINYYKIFALSSVSLHFSIYHSTVQCKIWVFGFFARFIRSSCKDRQIHFRLQLCKHLIVFLDLAFVSEYYWHIYLG